MALFDFLRSRKYNTLSDAVRSGDLAAVRKMLAAGVDPNIIPPNDDIVPLFYALHEGPEMVRLLIEHGAEVNVSGRGGATPLAKAEARGQSEVAAVLRAAGARSRAANEEFEMDPRFRLKLQERIPFLVLQTRIQYPTEKPASIADRVEPQLKYQYPPNMPPDMQRRVRIEIRELILRECRKS
jgi:ankyrin repeat protein